MWGVHFSSGHDSLRPQRLRGECKDFSGLFDQSLRQAIGISRIYLPANRLQLLNLQCYTRILDDLPIAGKFFLPKLIELGSR